MYLGEYRTMLPPLKWLSETRTDGRREAATYIWLRAVISAGYTWSEIRQAYEIHNGKRLTEAEFDRAKNQFMQLVALISEPPSGKIIAPLDTNGLIDPDGIIQSSDSQWYWSVDKWIRSEVLTTMPITEPSPTMEKAIETVSPQRMEALRAQVRAVYPNWNPDRMTMDYQPGDEMYTRLLLAEAGKPSLVRDDRTSLEQRQAQGGAATLLLAAAAAYLLL